MRLSILFSLLPLALAIPNPDAAHALADRTVAAPALKSDTPFQISVLSESDKSTTILSQFANAASLHFFIGVGANTYCIPGVPCGTPNDAIGNGTSIACGASGGGCGMYSEVPGGQDVYVNSTGALSFTFAHEEGNFPPGSATKGFSTKNGVFTFTGLGSTGWIACPIFKDGTGPYQVFAKVKGISNADVPNGKLASCIGFKAKATASDDDALVWQYD